MNLSYEQIEQIVQTTIAQKLEYKTAAQVFDIKCGLLRRLVAQALSRPEELQKLKLKTEKKRDQEEVIVAVAKNMISKRENIWSAQSVCELVKSAGFPDLKVPLVRQVFRKKLNMRYKKVKRVAF